MKLLLSLTPFLLPFANAQTVMNAADAFITAPFELQMVGGLAAIGVPGAANTDNDPALDGCSSSGTIGGDNCGTATFHFACDEAISSSFKFRLTTPDAKSDSFYIKSTNEVWDDFHTGIRNQATTSRSVAVSAGYNFITLATREDNAWLHSIELPAVCHLTLAPTGSPTGSPTTAEAYANEQTLLALGESEWRTGKVGVDTVYKMNEITGAYYYNTAAARSRWTLASEAEIDALDAGMFDNHLVHTVTDGAFTATATGIQFASTTTDEEFDWPWTCAC